MLAWPCMPGRLTIILTSTTRAVDGTTTISPPAPYMASYPRMGRIWSGTVSRLPLTGPDVFRAFYLLRRHKPGYALSFLWTYISMIYIGVRFTPLPNAPLHAMFEYLESVRHKSYRHFQPSYHVIQKSLLSLDRCIVLIDLLRFDEARVMTKIFVGSTRNYSTVHLANFFTLHVTMRRDFIGNGVGMFWRYM
jgi:hypothetical protein